MWLLCLVTNVRVCWVSTGMLQKMAVCQVNIVDNLLQLLFRKCGNFLMFVLVHLVNTL